MTGFRTFSIRSDNPVTSSTSPEGRENCPHCDTRGFAFEHLLEETPHFSIVCDVHPLMEGHLLIIPKEHIACAAEFSRDVFGEFVKLLNRCSDFLQDEYGSVSTFEHGRIGQTVFHAHTHLLPCQPDLTEIIPEGTPYAEPMEDITAIHDLDERDGGYLLLMLDGTYWSINPELGEPRFFRDRFASALGVPERGNWKEMHANKNLMTVAQEEIIRCKNRWHRASS